MKDLIIVGAGDFAREVAWLVSRINKKDATWNFLGFVDDNKVGQVIEGVPVLGSTEWLSSYDKEIYVTCAIGNGTIRKTIWQKLNQNKKIFPATLIDPTAIIGETCKIGSGSIICAGTIMTIATQIGFNCIVNLNCTIGHDSVLDDYCTLHPNSNISGKVHLGESVLVGTGTQIIQGLDITRKVNLGAGSVVVKNIDISGTYVGVPARLL